MDPQRMPAQRVAVPELVRQQAHRLEIAGLDGRQHGMHDAGRCRTFAHRRPVSVELGRIEVAMGVDPAIHGFIMHHLGAVPGKAGAGALAVHEWAKHVTVKRPFRRSMHAQNRLVQPLCPSAARTGSHRSRRA